MPSLDTYKRMKGNASAIGQVHKNQSDQVMEMTWYTDLATRTCYLYDYWHDDFKDQLRDLRPEIDKKKIPISLKYLANSSQTYDKDYVTYHIQMKPSQECNVPYYDEYFGKRYNGIFPLGLFVDIPDNKGKYNRWLVVNTANYYDAQFSTYEILPCDMVFNWIWKGQKIKMAGVLRSQNSYNSGIWEDYKFSSVEDQQKFVVSLNSLSEKLFYNQRMIIDTKVDVLSGSEPRAWKISKVNRISPSSLARITLAQDYFDQHRDYIEYEDETNPSTIIGMWADYWKENIIPNDLDTIPSPIIHSIITYSGVKPEVKVNGSFKKFTVTFYDDEENENEIPLINGKWEFKLGNDDASSLVEVEDKTIDPTLSDNQIKVKFIGSDEWINKNLDVWYVTDTINGSKVIKSHVTVNVIGL